MNRAFEFLGAALAELKKRRPDNKMVDLYIRLAVAEIQELAADGCGVLTADAQAMTPACFVERPRATLPGDGCTGR